MTSGAMAPSCAGLCASCSLIDFDSTPITDVAYTYTVVPLQLQHSSGLLTAEIRLQNMKSCGTTDGKSECVKIIFMFK